MIWAAAFFLLLAAIGPALVSAWANHTPRNNHNSLSSKG